MMSEKPDAANEMLSVKNESTTGPESTEATLITVEENGAGVADALTTAASTPESELAFLAVEKKRIDDGIMLVTFRWTGNADSYLLTVDGTDYTVTGTKYALRLEDGEHTCSLTADGTTVEGESFTTDATCPTLTIKEPQCTKLEDRLGAVTFSWECSEEASYEFHISSNGLNLDGMGAYSMDEATSLTLQLDSSYMYYFYVKAVDAASNVTETRHVTYTLPDIAAPWVETYVYTSRLEDGLSKVSFHFSNSNLDYGEEYATFELMVTGTTADGRNYSYSEILQDHNASNGQFQLQLEDGTYSYSIRTEDIYNNSRIIEGKSIHLDTILPKLEVTHSTNLFKSSGKVFYFTWSSSKELKTRGGYSFSIDGDYLGSECYTERLAYDGEKWAATVWTYGPLSDGEHTYKLRVTDTSGNVNTITGSFVVDEQALLFPIPELTVLEENLTQAVFNWSCTREVATYEMRIFKNNGLGGITTYAIEGESYTLNLTDGFYECQLKATDTAGNVVENLAYFTLDTTPPVLELQVPEREKLKEGLTQVTFSWTCSEKGVNYILTVNKRTYKLTDTSKTLSLADGSYSYSISATDAYGNTSTVHAEGPLVLDATAPRLKLGKPVLKTLREGLTQVTLNWECNEEDVSYQIFVDGYEITEVDGHTATLELADGEHTYSLTATDGHGNCTSVDSKPFTTDATAPVPELQSPEWVKRKEGVTQVTFSWTSSEKATYVLTVNGDTYKLTETSKTLSLADGSYSYSISATDAYGNTSTVHAEAPLVLDASAPDLEVLTPTLTNDNKLRWSGEEGATYTVVVDGITLCEEFTGNEITLEGLSQSKHNYAITAADASDNTTTLKGSFTYDSIAPEVTLSPPGLRKLTDNQTQVTLSWKLGTREKGVTYQLSIDGGVAISPTGTTYTTVLEDGSHHYSVIATDAAGNSSEPVVSDDFTTDTIAPEFDIMECRVTPNPDIPGSASFTLDWEVADKEDEACATSTLRIDGKLMVLAEGATSYTDEDIRGGAHEYKLTVTDSHGNSREQIGSFFIDLTPPALKLGKPRYAKTGNDGEMEVTLSWSSELGATFRVEVDGTTVYTGTDSSCRFLHADGEYDYRIIATDVAGNETIKTGTLSHDATAPKDVELHPIHYEGIQGEGDITPASNKGKGTVNFSWENTGEETGLTYTLMVDGRKVYSGKALSKRVTLRDGEHVYSLIVTDKAGNTTTLDGNAFSFDATAPVVTLDTPELHYAEDAEGGKATLSWQSSKEASYTLIVKKGKEEIIRKEEYLGTSFTTDTLDAGKYSYTLEARDYAGNGSVVKKGSFTIATAGNDDEAPVIGKLTHSIKGGMDGQASVTISWTSGEKGTFTLFVDDEITYVGTATRRTLTLAAGEHSYSVIATDKAGNRSEAVTGEFTYAAPAVDRRTATLSWEAQAGCSYELKVDNTIVTPTGGNSYSWAGLKDGKHQYTLTVTDARGCLTTCSGSFTADTKAPKVTLGKAKYSKAGEGLMNVTLSWKGEKGATYSLTVDGESVELSDPTATTCTLRGLADGRHIYSVTATDASGNESIATEKAGKGEFNYDATAPCIILGSISGTADKKTRTRASFCWAGEDGVSYTVLVDGKKQKVRKLTDKDKVTLSTLSVTTNALAAGVHSYTIIARDKAGNVSETSGSFTTDAAGNANWMLHEGGDAPTLSVIPADAQQLFFRNAEDTAGFASDDAAIADPTRGYRFELDEARQLLVKLSGLGEDATVVLRQEGGQGSISLRANQYAGLDRELSLSAGTYYLQVQDGENLTELTSGYTLDLELEKNGKKQPFAQASLAARV